MQGDHHIIHSFYSGLPDEPRIDVKEGILRIDWKSRDEAMAGRLGNEEPLHEPGSPWENRYSESFNGKLRDECLNGEIFYSLKEAQIIIESWRNHYNTKRPHSALGYRPPAPLTIAPKLNPAAIMN